MKKWILASLIGIMMGTVANAQTTAGGTLTINGTVTGTMTLTVNHDAAGAPVGGSGSSAGTINFGSVSASTSNGTVATGITKGTYGGGFDLSTVVDLFVTSANEGSLNYNLSASIDNTDQFAYVVNSVQLSTGQQLVLSNASYNSPVAVPVVVQVPTGRSEERRVGKECRSR